MRVNTYSLKQGLKNAIQESEHIVLEFFYAYTKAKIRKKTAESTKTDFLYILQFRIYTKSHIYC
jgi:hypothetical protein